MPQYVLAYHGGREPESPEEGARQMARWKAWLEDLGDAVVNPGMPMKGTKTVTAQGVEEGGGPNPIMGLTILKADSMDQALAMAKKSPFLEMGTIEIAEALQM